MPKEKKGETPGKKGGSKGKIRKSRGKGTSEITSESDIYSSGNSDEDDSEAGTPPPKQYRPNSLVSRVINRKKRPAKPDAGDVD